MHYRAFKDAREFVRGLKLKSAKEWSDNRKSGRPEDIPYSPETVYKGDWKGFADWLGTDRGKYFTRSSGELLPFEEAREFVRLLKLAGQKGWLAYCASGIISRIYSDENGNSRKSTLTYRSFMCKYEHAGFVFCSIQYHRSSAV